MKNWTYKKDFPILNHQKNGKSLVFLDSGASSQKPQCVIDAISNLYENEYANIHRGLYDFSECTTAAYEAVRAKVAKFINAPTADDIIFVRNTTEGINLVAYCLTQFYFKPGDEIIVSEMEHHANIVPWQVVCKQTGAELRVVRITDSGELDMDHYHQLLTDKTKLVALAHVSNVLGTINPVKDIIAAAHAKEVPVLLDGAQAVPHFPVDVSDLEVDFYIFSGHKCYGPSGSSALYISDYWMKQLPPYQTGGGMINEVTFEKTTYLAGAHRFEAGTPDIADVIGLGVAIDYLQQADMKKVEQHEQELLAYALQQLRAVEGLRIYGEAPQRVGAIAFTLADVHAHDIGTILNDDNVAVRAGHHCAMPLHKKLGVAATVRASLGIYNDKGDIDGLVEGLHNVKKLFGVV
ncbi:MAG: cysteine desulfurase [Coxiellaceae bacterium]|nr:cysteine desulfurase [Coxiellaceae bacterium]